MKGQSRTFEYSIGNGANQPVTQKKSQDNSAAFLLALPVHNAVRERFDAPLKSAEIYAGNRCSSGKSNCADPTVSPERRHKKQNAYDH